MISAAIGVQLATNMVVAGGVSALLSVSVLPVAAYIFFAVFFAVMALMIQDIAFCTGSHRCGGLDLSGAGQAIGHFAGGALGTLSLAAGAGGASSAVACVAGLAGLIAGGPLGLFGFPAVAIASGCPHVPPPGCDVLGAVGAAISLVPIDSFAIAGDAVSAFARCGDDDDGKVPPGCIAPTKMYSTLTRKFKVPRWKLSDALHDIKYDNHRPADYDVCVTSNGNVYDPADGQLLGNLIEGF